MKLICMAAFLAHRSDQCVPHLVQADVFVPVHMSIDNATNIHAILSASHISVKVNGTDQARPHFLASVGAARLSINDLRTFAVDDWGNQLTQRVHLGLDGMSVRLPSNTGSTSWTDAVSLGAVEARLYVEELTEEQVDELLTSAPYLESPTAPHVHQYVEVVNSTTGEPPGWGQHVWSQPLGLNVVLEDVRCHIIYSVLHPVAPFLGPSLRATGKFHLPGGQSVEVGVQLDRRHATLPDAFEQIDDNKTMPGLLAPRNGLYLASSANLTATDIVEMYVKTLAPGNQTRLPLALESIRTTAFYATLAKYPMRFEGPANNRPGANTSRFAYRPLPSGFHANFSGTAWGSLAHISMQADIDGEQKTTHDLANASMDVELLAPNALRVSVRHALHRVGAGTLADTCDLTNAKAHLDLGRPFADDDSARLRMHLEGQCKYGQLEIRMLLRPTFDNDLVAKNVSSLSSTLEESWPLSMAFGIRAYGSTTMHQLLTIYLAMGDGGLRGDGTLIPQVFRYISAAGDDVDACIAGQDAAFYCYAGAHAAIPIRSSGGLFGLAANAYFTSSFLQYPQTTGQFTPLVLDVVVRPEGLTKLLPKVVSGIIGALPPAHIAGAARFLAGIRLSSAHLHYSTDKADSAGSSLMLSLFSDYTCEPHILTIPLDLFAPLVNSVGAITPVHLQQVLTRMNYSLLLGFLSSDLSLQVDFIAATQVPAMVSKAILTSGSLASYFAEAEVCQLGMFIWFLELVPPSVPSEMCTATWLWNERARALKMTVGQEASCGNELAKSAWTRLRTFENRLRGLQPSGWMSRCTQAMTFFDGYRLSAALPALGIKRQLAGLQLILDGMLEAWSAEDTEELLELVPHAVGTLRGLNEWRPAAHQLEHAVDSLSGVLRAFDQASLSTVVSQMQQWGNTLSAVISSRPSSGVPDVATRLGSLYYQIVNIFPIAQLVVDSMATIDAEVTESIGKLSQLELQIAALRPQEAFSLLDGLGAIEAIDFGLISELLDASVAFLNNGQNLLETMTPYRQVLDSQCEPAPGVDCPLKTAGNTIVALDELMAYRTGPTPLESSPATLLAAYPDVVSSTLETLAGQVKTVSDDLGKAAKVVSQQADVLRKYLSEAMLVFAGPAKFVDDLSQAFFGSLESLMRSVDVTRAAIPILEDGEILTDALRSAASNFTASAYDALAVEATRLRKYLQNLAPQIVTPELEGMVTFVSSLLKPAIARLTSLVDLFPHRQYFDHMLQMPDLLLARLMKLKEVVSSATPLEGRIDPTDLGAQSQRVFDPALDLAVDLAELAAASSTCLRDASCQADLQTRTRAMRQDLRALQQQYEQVASVPSSINASLLSSIDQMTIADEIVQEMEVMVAWTRALTGRVPQLTQEGVAQSPSTVEQQMSHAMCKEFEVKAIQGRDATPPTWFHANCSELAARLKDGDNPVSIAIGNAAEALPLFTGLMGALSTFVQDLQEPVEIVNELIDSADGQAISLVQQADAFTDAFTGVAMQFPNISRYIDACQPVFDLKDAITELDAAVDVIRDQRAAIQGAYFSGVDDTGDADDQRVASLVELSQSTSAALLHAADAPSEPFACVSVPEFLDEIPLFASQVNTYAGELSYSQSVYVSTGQNVPVTFLSGIGDGTCFLRTGLSLVQAGLKTLTQPLEELIELFIQGPLVLRGDTIPSCPEEDTFCLRTFTRSDAIYRMITFPLFYLEFWSMSAPAISSSCKFLMSQRFTIPGLFTSSALQSSTLFDHQSVTKLLIFQCSRYTHIAGYAPALPGGCTSSYWSFFATFEPFGFVHTIYKIYTPEREKYAGSLTGIAISKEKETLWACGKEPYSTEYSLFTFKLGDIDSPFADMPNWGKSPSYAETTIQMCTSQPLGDIVPGTAMRCNLAWDYSQQRLWVGNTAMTGEVGSAMAFQSTSTACADGGRAHSITIQGNAVATVRYGEFVVSFTFLKDLLHDDYLSLSRCDLFNVESRTRDCKMEFHAFSPQNQHQELASSTLEIRTPAGFGNVAADSALGIDQVDGGYMHASFLSGTSEYIIDSDDGGSRSMEDRIFTLQTPIITTGVRKSVDRATLTVANVNLVPGIPLLPFIPLEPLDPPPVLNQGPNKVTPSPPPSPPVGLYGRRLQSAEVLRSGPGSILPSACNAESSFPVPDDAEDYEFKGCLGGTIYLINSAGGSAPSAGMSFSIGVGPLSIKGSFTFTPTLVIGVTANLCLDAWKLRFGIDFQTGIEAELYMEAGIDMLMKAYLRMNGRGLGLVLQPMMTADIKRALVGVKFDLGIELISIAVMVGIKYPVIHFCRTCPCWGGCCFSFPCGWSWGSAAEEEFDRISVGTGGVQNIINVGDEGADTTPPTLGMINISQLSVQHVDVNFANFGESESDILSTQLTIQRQNADGWIYYCTAFEGSSQSWSGELQTKPEHGEQVVACVVVRNSYGLATSKCSDLITWDGIAPKVSNFYTVNPFTGGWRMLDPGCNADIDDCRLFTNASTTMKYAMRIDETPLDYGNVRSPIKTAIWALSTGAPCIEIACIEGQLLMPFKSVGNVERLMKGEVGKYYDDLSREYKQYPVLEVFLDGLSLINGAEHFFNIHLCDQVSFYLPPAWPCPFSFP